MITKKKNFMFILMLISLILYYSCFSKGKDEVQLAINTKEIIEIIKQKNFEDLMSYIPDINFEVWNNKFLTKNELLKDFEEKGRIYKLVFCDDIIEETEPLCIREDLNNNKIKIKEIIQKKIDQEIVAEVFLTWDVKEKEKKNKNNITSYLDKFTYIKIGDKWFLYNFKVWEGQ